MSTEWKYALYIAFMSFVFISFSKFKKLPMSISIRRVEIAAILFTANFFLKWFAFQEQTCGPLVDTYPLAFNIIFFTTMISAPGVILYTVAAWFIHNMLIAKQEVLLA